MLLIYSSIFNDVTDPVKYQTSEIVGVSVNGYGSVGWFSSLFYLLYQYNMVHGARIKIKQCTCMALPNSKNKRDCFFLKKGTDLYRQYVARFEVHFSIHKMDFHIYSGGGRKMLYAIMCSQRRGWVDLCAS
jgi:hypothetical protein